MNTTPFVTIHGTTYFATGQLGPYGAQYFSDGSSMVLINAEGKVLCTGTRWMELVFADSLFLTVDQRHYDLTGWTNLD